MKVPQCDKEQAVAEMVQGGHWPDSCDPALKAHLEHCAACSEVVLAAQFLLEEKAALLATLKLPDAGLVWWKAQLRARREAAATATRPIALAERFALACGLAGLVACLVWKWAVVHAWLGGLSSFGLSDARWFFNLLLDSWNQPFASLFIASASLLVLFMACLVYAIWARE
jgi:hypothetical protein